MEVYDEYHYGVLRYDQNTVDDYFVLIYCNVVYDCWYMWVDVAHYLYKDDHQSDQSRTLPHDYHDDKPDDYCYVEYHNVYVDDDQNNLDDVHVCFNHIYHRLNTGNVHKGDYVSIYHHYVNKIYHLPDELRGEKFIFL